MICQVRLGEDTNDVRHVPNVGVAVSEDELDLRRLQLQNPAQRLPVALAVLGSDSLQDGCGAKASDRYADRV